MTLDVRDFDTPQTALDAVTGEGGSVYFPAGFYEITAGLRPKSGTRIFGDGRASVITCPPSGWQLGSVTNYGLFNIDNKAGVEVTGLRVRGTKSATHTTTPKLIYSHDATDISLHGCWLENTSFEGIWQGGTQANNRRLSIRGNYINDVGHPAGSYVGLPAIQMNGEDVVIEGNILTDVGTGVGASGARILVSNNRISGVTVDGIGAGDSGDSYGVSIVGNSIEVASSPDDVRRAIRIGGGLGEFGVVLAQGNYIRVLGDAAHQPSRGIQHTTARRSHIVGNVIEMVGKGVGINVYGGPDPVDAGITGNLVHVFNEAAACYGITGIPNGSGKTLRLVSSNNRVLGLTAAMGSFAYDFTSNGGGTLDARMMNDWCEQGHVRLGGQYFGGGQMDSIPINLS